MDAADKPSKVHPRATSNPISALFFWWTTNVFVKGYKKELEVNDLYDALVDHKSERLGNVLDKVWASELDLAKNNKKKAASLLSAIRRIFGLRYMGFGMVLLIIECVVKVAQPIFLGFLIRYFSPPTGSEEILKEDAYLYAGGVVLCSGLNILMIYPTMMGIVHMGMQIRVAICTTLYRKSLRLSYVAMGKTTTGQAVNLLSNDVNRFDNVPVFLHYMWIGLLQTVIISYLMWTRMGFSALMGVAVLLLIIPLQAFLGKKTSSFRLKTAVRTDERVRLMNEILSGIQVIKMYTWEKSFAKLVAMARSAELKQIRLTSYIRGLLLSFIMFTTRTTLYVSVVAYVLLGNDLTAEKVFVMASYYNILRQTMTIFFPQAIAQLAEGLVSVQRIQNFLMLEEVSNDSHSARVYLETEKGQTGVEVKGAKAQWSKETNEPTLIDVNMTLQPGKLVAVIGPVGSGKSSLINAVLGELPLSQGSVEVRGKLSYAAQEPWVFAGSIRQNILFGQPWDASRYKEVVKVCALQRDFTQFPHGDLSLVGERGISLSGGQRARVNLARAVYKQADVYLLDDPLSAVDAHVGRHLFDECIKGFLRHKSVLLVTHQLQYLTQANNILILNNGHVEVQGPYAKLMESGLDFAKLLAHQEGDDTENEEQEDDKQTESLGKLLRRISSRESRRSRKSLQDSENTPTAEVKGPKAVAEMRTVGTISGKVYGEYLAAGGSKFVITIIMSLFVLAQIAGSAGDYWVTYWTNWEEINHGTVTSWRTLLYANDKSDDWLSTEICIYIYTVLIVAVIVFSLWRAFSFYNACMRASQTLHNRMFTAITRATMSFFNNNPSGRILNRFSKDMGSIDEILPSTMIDAVQIGLTLLGIVIVVSIVNYWLLIPTVITGIIFYFLRVVYLKTSRSVKRVEGITRSPVFTHLNASIQGMTTIRAFQAQEILELQFDNHQDVHSAAWYLFISTSRAFGMCLDIICFFYIAIVTFSFLLLDSESTFGADVGLAITQTIGMTGMFQWGMRQSAELENQMTSVERVLEFTELESEPPLETKEQNKPPEPWPKKGEVKFDKLSLRYSPSDPCVLSEIDFTLISGEKIGIVGRTGAGKSSLITALFRLAECPSGRILIDGIDTSLLGLHQLRANISIIPQEPVLFSGTMRKNLDPFDEYSDEILWQALTEVELKEAVSELAGGLSAHMSEGGSNFSVGQRQLVCLARAIVRNNRILVLDEATANVDPKTDTLIQSTIRHKFKHCTVLTIAHRLHTVMDSDRVLVMDAGRVAELAPPAQLLADPKSMLSSMVQQTGTASAVLLRQRANQSTTDIA